MALIHPIPSDPRFKNHTGKRFGRWIAVEYAGKRLRDSLWLCRYDCGTQRIVVGGSLVSGDSKSCGCLNLELSKSGKHTTHGMSYSKTYRIWGGVLSRCNNPSHHTYANYGGRGIRVSDRWHKFENFLADMGEVPPGCSLDRFPDNGGNYEPGNCRWASIAQQSRNTRSNRMITIGDKTMCLTDWAAEAGCNRATISARLNRGVPAHLAVFGSAYRVGRIKAASNSS